MMYSIFVTIALLLSVDARLTRRAAVDLKNGQDALALNDKFKTLKAGDACTVGENACIDGKFSQCVNGKFTVIGCAPATVCSAIPLAGTAGTTVICDTQADIDSRIAATGAKSDAAAAAPPTAAADNAAAGGAANAGSEPQTSLTLDPKVIAKGFANDGQSVPAAGQVASLTSTNNFINFCLTSPGTPLTDGKQIMGGSCNPAPMGIIPSVDRMPSSKFVSPKNGDVLPADKPFTISMAIKNLVTGNFVNAKQNYFSAPQQLTGDTIKGHSHVVVEKLTSLDQTTPTSPGTFAFFKGLNGAANGGILTADVTSGLPAGFYRLASINTAANHQPVLVPVAQHGSLDDMVYFTITAGGAPAANGPAGKGRAE